MELPGRRGFAGGMIATLFAPLLSRVLPRPRGPKVGSATPTALALAPQAGVPAPRNPARAALIRPPLVAPALNGDDLFKRNPRVRALIDSKPMLRGLETLLYEHIRNAINSVAPGLSP